MTTLKLVQSIARKYDDAVLSPLREQRARTPNADYIRRHESAFHTPRPGFEAALACGLVALRDYACAHEERYGSTLGQDGVLGEAWLDALRGFRALLNGELGRLDGGFLDGAICNLYQAAGFEGDL